MTEAVFPLLGPALVVLVVLPLAAVLARMGLELLRRAPGVGALRGLGPRYVLLVASSLLPIAWFASAALHQAETGRSVLACVVEHGHDSACVEPRLFSLALLAAMTLLALPTLLGTFRRSAWPAASGPHRADERIRAIVDRTPGLADLRGRVEVDDELAPAIATRGLVRPVVVVRSSYLDALDDNAIAAALAHELEHVRHRDPLRYLLLSLSLALNPLGRLSLRREVQRWIAAREAQCDHDAVMGGAEPTALAHALVRAARPGASASPLPALAATDLAMLQLRVELLMSYAERPLGERRPRAVPVLRVALALLVVVVVWPHSGETRALDVLHVGAERAAASLLP